MILVTGATGHLGKAVVEFLLRKTSPPNIAVLARDAAKASEFKTKDVEVRQGDYNDYASLVKAFTGVDKLYFVSGSDVVSRLQQHVNVVNAAKEAGVKHVLYTSFLNKNETETSSIAFVSKSHIHTEKILKQSGLIYTILKHAVYMDMIPMFIGDKVLETGSIFQPAGNGKAAFASRKDMAEAAAQILTTEGHENESYEISGAVSYSYDDVAKILGELTGKKIAYVSPEKEVYIEELTKAGVPADYAAVFAAFSEAIKQGEFDTPGTTLEGLLGRKPVSLKDFLSGVYAPVAATV